MSKTVFILGAGTSKQVGAPVMAEFLDYAENIIATGHAGEDKPAFQNVFKGINALQAVYTKSFIDTRNLEAVFTTFEMAGILGNLEGYKTPDACRELLRDLRKVIVRTLELGTKMASPDREPLRSFGQFVKYLKACHNDPQRQCSVITFNYDCALDYALFKGQLGADYGLDPTATFSRPPIDLLKLHGSLNWVTTGIEENGRSRDKIVQLSPADFHLYVNDLSPDTVYATIARVAMQRFAIPADRYEPVIVPPTWAKPGHYEQLGEVWKRAAKHLAEAENIIVIGYSLPPTDEFFRNLFALGTVGSARLRRVWVFDKSPSPEMDRRYRHLLGRLAEPVYALHAAEFATVAAGLSEGDFAAFEERRIGNVHRFDKPL